MGIGENIRRFRKDGRYTQKQLAEIIGVKASYISALERGQRRPGKKILPLLCDALGVDEWAIYFGTREVYGGGLSPDEKTLILATAGLTKDELRAVLQFIWEMKHPEKKIDRILYLDLPTSIRCTGGAYLAPLEDGYGRTRQREKGLQM
jgi:transcriptional regulator with XRE-family HTH domain